MISKGLFFFFNMKSPDMPIDVGLVTVIYGITHKSEAVFFGNAHLVAASTSMGMQSPQTPLSFHKAAWLADGFPFS